MRRRAPVPVAQIVMLYRDQNILVVDICKRLDVSLSTVYQSLKDAQVKACRKGLVKADTSERIVALYRDQRIPVAEICRQLEVSTASVYKVLEAAGVERWINGHKNGYSSSAIDVESVICRYNAGETAKAIGAGIGRSHQGVLDLLRRNGVDIRSVGQKRSSGMQDLPVSSRWRRSDSSI